MGAGFALYVSAEHAERVVELDPTNAEARQMLNFRNVDGEWMTREQMMSSRGLVFHSGTVAVPGWPDPALGWINALNGIMLMKNITLAGAYLLLVAFGAGAYSVDAKRGAAVAHA